MQEIQWRYNVGDRVVNYNDDGSLITDWTITDRQYINKQRVYTCRCNVCGNDIGKIRDARLTNRKKGCEYCRVHNWKYNIGDRIIIKGNDDSLVIDYTITNREVRVKKARAKNPNCGYDNYNYRWYEYTCNICGATAQHQEESNIGIKRCPCCLGKKKIVGINTIGDLHPEYIPYFKGNDAFNPNLSNNQRYDFICPVCKHTKNMSIGLFLQGFFHCEYCHSVENKRPDLIKYLVNQKDALLTCGQATKVKIKCPDCGLERSIAIKDLVNRGFRCTACGDYISYPEKFLANILEQLHVLFIRQFSSKDFQWCDKYRYDFYIPELNTIIETNGIQHYENGVFGQQNLLSIQENDEDKKRLALKNNIAHYIVLDCRYSTPDWIKTSIIQSQLNEIYDLSLIDWNAAAEFALKGIVKDVCLAWRNGQPVKDIAENFHIDRTTVYDYLKTGTSLGWCDYDSEKEITKQKKRIAVFIESKLIKVFDSITQMSANSKHVLGCHVHESTISQTCKSDSGKYKNFIFRYASEVDL